MIRRWLSRIAVRLLLFNVLLVFLPVAGLFSLRSLERQLLDLQERSMVQQGRLVAAALSTGPELSADAARGLIQRLAGRSEARIRIVDRDEKVLADSAVTMQAASGGASDLSGESERAELTTASSKSRTSVLYRIGVALYRPLKALRDWRNSGSASAYVDTTPRGVLMKALGGSYGATVRESAGQRSLTLYSALPIRVEGKVIGAVVVSQSTSRILRALWRVRLDVFEVFVLSVLAAVVLSLLVSATIARPLIRLRNEADELLDQRGRLRATFRGSGRRDEIGDLTRALEKLTARLERHLTFVESFSADVSHEFKNPLASIRSAAELLPATEDVQQREELVETIDREVARLSRLLGGVREVSKVDAALDLEPVSPVNLGELLSELAKSHRAELPKPIGIDLTLPAEPVRVTASADRLVQAFGNVLQNAISFSPAGSRVAITLRAEESEAVMVVEDEGPGIPPEHLDRIFARFFTWRPGADADPRAHDGLGLSISRAIIEGYGGTITAANGSRGARLEIRLPLTVQ